MTPVPVAPVAATAPPAPATTVWRGGWLQGLNYGGLGLPLAFVALPLYVVLPNHYAAEFGIPLATLGALLLGARLLDAVADPWIGRLVDGWFTVSAARVLMAAAIAAVVLALGFRGLFFPAVQGTEALLWWCGALLAVTYLSYSVLSVLHQAWGARLGGDEGQRARIVSWREGLALLGVLVASVLPSVAGLSVTGIVFTLLLGARLLDAVADPLIGRWADAWLSHSARRVLVVAALAAVLLALTYLSYSVLSVLHQAWGARLGGGEDQRAGIVAWREGLALVGVLLASVLPSVAGLSVTSGVFALALLLGLALLVAAPRPQVGGQAGHAPSLLEPLQTPAFRRLLAIYLINGVASAVPATLVLFFIRDRLQAPDFEPLFLASYFAAGALSMPLWVRLVARLGLAWAWAVGMVVAIVTFAWAALLGAGDVAAFTAVCVASGFALGADLTLPGALLTGVIQRAGHAQKLEGAYFGWWNFATKLNLALAAGIALPLLGVFGYSPGGQDEGALRALTLAYCILPCALKLGAAGLLWTLWLRKETRP